MKKIFNAKVITDSTAQCAKSGELQHALKTGKITLDDVYSELSHQSIMPLPIKHWDKSGWVIWCSSVSKTLAPGIRLGWCSSGRFVNQFIQHRNIKTLGIINHYKKD